MRRFFCAVSLLLSTVACKERNFQDAGGSNVLSTEESQAAKSRLVRVLTQTLGLSLEAAEKILTLVQRDILNTDAIDLGRYGGFAFGKQGFLNFGNAWNIDVGVMDLHGSDSLSVSGAYQVRLERPGQRRLNVEIGKRVVLVIPKEHYVSRDGMDALRYSGTVMNFSDKVAIGALSHEDGKKAIFVWVFTATSLEQVVSSSVTEEVTVTLQKKERP